MAQVFDARRAIYVQASGDHPEFTEYRVAWGFEKWGDDKKAVTKVQMVYKGKVAGMFAPSYPDKTMDETAVKIALDLLKKGYGTGSKKSKTVLILKDENINDEDAYLDEKEDELFNFNAEIFSSNSQALSPVIEIEHKETIHVQENKEALIFQVEIS